MANRTQSRRYLDLELDRLRPLVDIPRPHKGWIRAIRDALGMSSTELAARLGVSQQRASELERGELRETIKLETLRRAADALDCDLVYALVPRSSLEESVARQAHRKASAHLDPVAHHSRLEDQAIDEESTAAQLEDLSARFIDRRGLWTNETSPR